MRPATFSAIAFFLCWTPLAISQDDDDELKRGLWGHYRSSSGQEVERVDNRVAFGWKTTAPDPRLSEGGFTAIWNGYLMSQAPGEYRLAASVAGELEIRLGDRVVLEHRSDEVQWSTSAALPLEFDYHPLRITYRKTSDESRLALFWTGPQFQLEPIGERYFFHDASSQSNSSFERGAELVRGLRCAACHEIAGEPSPLQAPSLAHVADSLHREWLVERLQVADSEVGSHSRMPNFSLSESEAQQVAAYLWEQSQPAQPPPLKEDDKPRSNRKRRKKVDPVEAGKKMFVTVGCLACHAVDGTRENVGVFGGGNLTRIASKRPRSFFETWLASPEAFNPDHRMPVFAFASSERKQLASYLATLGSPPQTTNEAVEESDAIEQGRQLVEKLGCANCHRLGEDAIKRTAKVTLASVEASEVGCLAAPDGLQQRPGFGLRSTDQDAVREYVNGLPTRQSPRTPTAIQRLAENNCLACHARGEARGLAAGLPQITATHAEYADQLPAMTPPSLNQVGDKLRRSSLQSVIAGQAQLYRDYLLVRMPRFPLADADRDSIVDHFIQMDRIPDAASDRNEHRKLDEFALRAAGSRLVTPDGFGCTSCHQVGSVVPVKAQLNARGPNLSMCGDRVRKSWFDRFVANPARIVPALEMPSVRIAVRGVLEDDLPTQLNAVWDVLNQPGFEPPAPNPVRVVRHSGLDPQARAWALTDVLRTPSRTYLKPLLIGLSNRHNLLFDLEKAQLARWALGDTGRQRTEGKTWYWETAGNTLLRSGAEESEISLEVDGQHWELKRDGQFATEIDALEHDGAAIRFRYRLRFVGSSAEAQTLRLEEQLTPLVKGESSGFRRRLIVRGAPARSSLRLRINHDSAPTEMASRTIQFMNGAIAVHLQSPQSTSWQPDGSLLIASQRRSPIRIELDYLTTAAVDRFTHQPLELPQPDAAELNVVPGFEVTRLPIHDELMPTGLAWRPNGDLVIASLKGRVWIARDSDGDGLEDEAYPFSDELPAPYGVAARDDYIDVITKFALLRMYDDDQDGKVDRTRSVASGWGHTTDYHDWAVGLPQDATGNYYVALPCQQDDRSAAAAHLRGVVLRLVPRKPTAADPREYTIDPLTGGHRFPMGMALSAGGDLFVTDNQGNYNPFNELNHIARSRRFGFINKLERAPDFNPPLTAPAIDIPHPWTRSVNGICFLNTPPEGKASAGHFGPFEGHLIGSEMDTQRLVRMTLHKVEGEYQGAAYPFSWDRPTRGEPFLGPLSCAVAPDGDIYVGGLRDSGWGGGNNIGELARMRPIPEQIPCGIAEVQATPNGLSIRFTKPVDSQRAADLANYSVETYTRTSTPAYGGDDEDRGRRSVQGVQVSDDGMNVNLKLDAMLAGYVYELRIKNLSPGQQEFFPAEAHYTMRRVPTSATQPNEGAE